MGIQAWIVSVGIVGFVTGYIAPIAFTNSNLGPLLGIFLTGPDGLLLGFFLGYMCYNLSLATRTQLYIWCMHAVIIIVGISYILHYNNLHIHENTLQHTATIDMFTSFLLPLNVFYFLLYIISVTRNRILFGCLFPLALTSVGMLVVMLNQTKDLQPSPAIDSANTVTPITFSSPLTTVQVTTLAFGLGQAFDAQRLPSLPIAGKLFTVIDLRFPLDSTGMSFQPGKYEYLQIFYVGGNCKDGLVGVNLHNVYGEVIRTVQPSGHIYGLSVYGFLFVSANGTGTFFTLQPTNLYRIAYFPNTGPEPETCAALQSYQVPPEAMKSQNKIIKYLKVFMYFFNM